MEKVYVVTVADCPLLACRTVSQALEEIQKIKQSFGIGVAWYQDSDFVWHSFTSSMSNDCHSVYLKISELDILEAS